MGHARWGDGPLNEALSMQFRLHQKILVRKTRHHVSRKKLSLSEWIDKCCFTAEVVAISENNIGVVKLDTEGFYGKKDRKLIWMSLDTLDYDLVPLLTEPVYQTDPLAISVA